MITHSNDLRDALANAINTFAKQGTLNPTARVQVAADAGFVTVLATLIMSSEPFQPAAAGAITSNPITADSACVGGGTAAYFRVINRDTVAVFSGTVTKAGAPGTPGDLVLSETAISPGDYLAIPSITYVTQT